MDIKTFGSVCSGIECATLIFKPLGINPVWFSETSNFQCRLLEEKYPHIQNVGDMNNIPTLIDKEEIICPDLICGGTPCQAFSLAGYQSGLNDERGNLTLKFVDIVDTSDKIRIKNGLDRSVVLWENVEGVLTDKTNAFGCFISALSGTKDVLEFKKYPKAGVVRGSKRNVAWRVLDAKYFGVPQQRKRLYLIACDKKFNPENILFEIGNSDIQKFKPKKLSFEKNGHNFEVFREYTDCLYSAYGTKWNGNAAAYNGSLFVVQDNRIRRLSPLECERLMGLPDEYTNIEKSKRTQRYQAIGNSWAIPVVRWIGERLISYNIISENEINKKINVNMLNENDCMFFCFDKVVEIENSITLNCSTIPNEIVESNIKDIISFHETEDIYISPVGCNGILRRSQEKGIRMNTRLKKVLEENALKEVLY